jgi:hypothetical protein
MFLLRDRERPRGARDTYICPKGRNYASDQLARQSGITMMPGASVSFFRPEFDDFLYAAIGSDKDEMPLSVLSALARLNIDPWEEAAELSELPRSPAVQRLASLIAQLQGGRWTQADSRTIAVRLIELLPHRGSSKVVQRKVPSLREMGGSTGAKLLLCAALAAIVLILAASREPSSSGDHLSAPAFDTSSPPQTSRPSSR